MAARRTDTSTWVTTWTRTSLCATSGRPAAFPFRLSCLRSSTCRPRTRSRASSERRLVTLLLCKSHGRVVDAVADVNSALVGFLLSLTPLSWTLMGWRGAGGSGSASIGWYFFAGGLLMILGGIGEVSSTNFTRTAETNSHPVDPRQHIPLCRLHVLRRLLARLRRNPRPQLRRIQQLRQPRRAGQHGSGVGRLQRRHWCVPPSQY